MIRIALAFAAFIALGMPDTLLGVAWPSMHPGLAVDLDAAGLLIGAATGAYTLSSLLAVRVMRWLRLGVLLSLSVGLTALGLFAYLWIDQFAWLVLAVFVSGLGAGAVDVAVQQYAIEYHSPALMQWLHASFGVGVTLGPAIMGLALASDSGWRLGYLVVGAGLTLLALLFALTLERWPPLVPDDEPPVSYRHALGVAVVRRAGLMFAIYCGAELAVGMWGFSFLTLARGVDPASAAFWVSGFWAAFTLARMVAGPLSKRLTHWQMVAVSLGLAGCGTALLIVPGPEGLGLLVLGAGLGPIYPALMSATPDRVGQRLSEPTVALQVTLSAVGAGAITAMMGVVVERNPDLGFVASVGLLVLALSAIEWRQRAGRD